MDDKRDDLWTGADTLRQLRIHFLLEEHFRLEQAARPRRARGWKVAAALLRLSASRSSWGVSRGVRRRPACASNPSRR